MTVCTWKDRRTPNFKRWESGWGKCGDLRYIRYRVYSLISRSVAVVAECLFTRHGTAYMGAVSRTRSGQTCQRWDTQTPHSHPYVTATFFPDQTVAAAGNRCRNPRADRAGGVWCYTNQTQTQWEYCDVPRCGNCFVLVLGLPFLMHCIYVVQATAYNSCGMYY